METGDRKKKMEKIEGESSAVAAGEAARYTLKPIQINNEDIIICVDISAESLVEMKTTGANGKPLTRLDSIKQAILLFVHSKLAINPDHRFAFATLAESASWLWKEFSNNPDSAYAAIEMLSATSYSGQADLTNLFRIAAHEAKKSRTQDRILRVLLIYCRSSVQPRYQWPVNQKLFTLDVMYLHDKPESDNCPQAVYDRLVDALEQVSEYEGYIFESGQGLTRVLFRHMSVLLSHPQQRCSQDQLDIPRSIKKPAAAELANSEDSSTTPISIT